ncbi:tetratricopeptide repeat protein, partial [Maribacter sp.]|nr:tetratricopeptide repeat protein [Maribacter sp.]
MKKISLILLWGALACNFLSAQNSKIDSLKTVWGNPSQIDSTRFEAGLGLFMLQFRENLDTARTIGHQLLQFAIENKNQDWEASSNRFIGNSFAVQGKYEDALKHFLKSHEILLELNDKKGLAATFSNIGAVYYELGNYPTALTYLLKGLKLAEELDDKPNLARVTNNLGNVYVDQKNNKKALEYYQYSLNLKEELGNRRSLPHTFNNIGLVYTNLKNSNLALENLQKSAKIAEEVDDQKSVTRAYTNIGAEYHAQGDFATALNYLNKAVELKKEINDTEGLPTAYAYRAQTYVSLKKYRLAIQDAEKALELSLKTGALIVQKQSYECLSEAWEKLMSPGKSLLYHKKAITLRDSLFNQERTNEITRQEMQYQFEKQQLSDSIAFTKQKADQELLFEKNLSRQRNTLYLVLFGSLALLLFGGFYWKNKQKNKKIEHERNVVTRLKQVDALKDQFLANTSHELRTPLSGIIGLSESLKDGAAGKMSLKAIENLDMISNSGKRLSHLVNDILDFSKLKNQDLVLSSRPIDIHAVADVVLKLSKPLLQGKHVQLLNSVPKDVVLVEADENRLQQILHNLVGNAIKFTEQGQVEIKAEEKDTMLSISITDTGIGIPKDKFQNIFRSFEQADGATQREYGGTGLG